MPTITRPDGRASALAFALASLTLMGLTGVAPAHAGEPALVKTKIKSVTVYADRAQVTRVGDVDLSAGAEIVVEGLPGWIDHESVRVTLSKGTILDVAPKTTHLAKSAAEEVRKADAAVQEINDKLRVINDDRAVLNAEIRQLQSLRAFTTAKLPRTMSVRKVKMKEIAETLDFIANRMRAAKKGLRDLDAKSRDLRPELNKRSAERNELRNRSLLKQTRVAVAVKGSGKAKLKIIYMTPGAAWEPSAELRVKKGETASLVQYASVVNTTGEDWAGAKLSFSTQRPGQILRVPEAKALLMGGGKGLGAVVGATQQAKSFSAASSNYVQMNRMSTSNKTRGLFEQNYRRQQAAQKRALSAFAKLKNRGTTAHFEAKSQRAVRSNGKAVRIPITEGAFAVKTQLVAVPEVSLNAVRTAKLTNTTDQPILPGSVALFVNGAFLGKSQLSFVAPGETFSAFLGVDTRVKLSRVIDRKRSKMDRGRKRTEVTASFLITVRNLSSDPLSVLLTDRVPVVQDDNMEIDDVILPKHASRSRDGLVKWTVNVGPRKSGVYRIEYSLEYPNRIAVKAKENRKMRRKKKHRRPNAAPSPRSKQEFLFDQIDSLENML